MGPCQVSRISGIPPEVGAFLDMLAVSEIGARMLALTDDGYDVLVGSTPAHLSLFDSYVDHPRKLVRLGNLGIKSSAAGRYQFLERTWDGLVKGWGKPPRSISFDPENQDRGAIELLRQCKAYPQIVGGDTEQAVHQARGIWASLPGAGYGQHENRLDDLLEVFNARLAHYKSEPA